MALIHSFTENKSKVLHESSGNTHSAIRVIPDTEKRKHES